MMWRTRPGARWSWRRLQRSLDFLASWHLHFQRDRNRLQQRAVKPRRGGDARIRTLESWPAMRTVPVVWYDPPLLRRPRWVEAAHSPQHCKRVLSSTGAWILVVPQGTDLLFRPPPEMALIVLPPMPLAHAAHDPMTAHEELSAWRLLGAVARHRSPAQVVRRMASLLCVHDSLVTELAAKFLRSPAHRLSVGLIAQRMRISQRTLERVLGRDGLSPRDVLDQVRLIRCVVLGERTLLPASACARLGSGISLRSLYRLAYRIAGRPFSSLRATGGARLLAANLHRVPGHVRHEG